MGDVQRESGKTRREAFGKELQTYLDQPGISSGMTKRVALENGGNGCEVPGIPKSPKGAK